MPDANDASNVKFLPVIEYIHKRYLTGVTEPGGDSAADVDELLATLKEKQKVREQAIQYLRSLTPSSAIFSKPAKP